MLIIAITFVIAAFLVVMYLRARGREEISYEETYETLEEVLEGSKQEMVDIIKEDCSLTVSNEEFDRLYKRKARINDALKKCVYGIDNAKVLVMALITDFIEQNVSDEAVNSILGLNFDEGGEPSDQVMFEIIMYRFKKRYGKNALDEWIKKNNFARERRAIGSDDIFDKAYYITVDDLHKSYQDEKIVLTEQERREVLSVLVYQNYKGFGCIDTIREMNINGLSLGVSGSILEATANADLTRARATSSAWLYYEGKEIHLQFINFGTEDELRRIIQLLIRWNSPGALTAKRGFIVNTMYDKSRILAIRPPASEYWAVFIRKFNLSDVTPEMLLIKSYTRKGELAVQLIKYIIQGEQTCAVTGRQGSGKTTLMSSIIRFIDPRYAIRVLEMAPELYLRELYPNRNILSFQETTTVTADMLQDAQKKTNGVVSLVGEVATDKVAQNMVQMGMTASKFTIFSHHGNTPEDLVITLRNSLVNAGNFSNMETAEKQVIEVVRIDIHLEATAGGQRYIERISEIVPLSNSTPYPDIDEDNLMKSLVEIVKEKAFRQTDRLGFKTVEILGYDLETNTYIPKNRFTKSTEDAIKQHLGPERALQFEYFMLENWGVGRKIEDDIDIYDDEQIKNMGITKEVVDKLREEAEEAKRLGKEMILTDAALQKAGESVKKELDARLEQVTAEANRNADDVVDFIDGVEVLKGSEAIDLTEEFTSSLFENW